jgi:hAT family C-terminal dimerisation region
MGRFGALWEVLPTIEALLKDVKDSVNKYSAVVNPEYAEELKWDPVVQRHLHNACHLAWDKLDKYYKLTDDTPAYTASICLHPAFKRRWLRRKWQDNPKWIKTAETAIEKLWKPYTNKSLKDILTEDEIKQHKALTGQQDTKRKDLYIEEDLNFSSDEDEVEDDYEAWQQIPRNKAITNPIAYWMSMKLTYPRLYNFALDLLGVPAMSSEPERVFSNAGRMVRPDRSRLKADIIGAAACLRQWDRYEVIDWKPIRTGAGTGAWYSEPQEGMNAAGPG